MPNPKKKPTKSKRARLEEYYNNPNVQAYLAGIRFTETGDTDINLAAKSPNSTARGPYQFLDSSQKDILNNWGVNAYSADPRETHLAALGLMAYKPEGLESIKKGDFKRADAIYNTYWTSLPGGSQPNVFTPKISNVRAEELAKLRKPVAPPKVAVRTIPTGAPPMEMTEGFNLFKRDGGWVYPANTAYPAYGMGGRLTEEGKKVRKYGPRTYNYPDPSNVTSGPMDQRGNPNLVFGDGGNTAYESWYRYNTPEGREGFPESYSSYDYQRYYNDAVRGLNPMGFDEGSQHFPDTYKYPWHPTFSDESIYYTNQKETPALSYNTKADWKEYLKSKKSKLKATRAKGGWTGYPDHTMYSSAEQQFDRVRDYTRYDNGAKVKKKEREPIPGAAELWKNYRDPNTVVAIVNPINPNDTLRYFPGRPQVGGRIVVSDAEETPVFTQESVYDIMKRPDSRVYQDSTLVNKYFPQKKAKGGAVWSILEDRNKFDLGGELGPIKKTTYDPSEVSAAQQPSESISSITTQPANPVSSNELSYDQIQGNKVLVQDFSPKYDYVLSGDKLYYQVKGGKSWADISKNTQARKNISDFISGPVTKSKDSDMFAGMSDRWDYSSTKPKTQVEPSKPSQELQSPYSLEKAMIKNVMASKTVPSIVKQVKPLAASKEEENSILEEIDKSLDNLVDYAVSNMGGAANAWNSLSDNISDLTDTGLKGIKRKLMTNFGIGEEEGAEIQVPQQSLKPKTLEEYYSNKSGNEISATIDVPDNTGRQYKQQTLNTSTIKFAPRARGEYKDIETDGLEVTTFSPFTDGKGFKDNQTVLAVDSAGNLQAGSFKDFKGKSGFLFSPTYRNNIMEFSEKNGVQEYVSGEKTGNRKYTHPKVKVLDDSGKEVDGLLNILVQNDNKKNFYGSIQGGRVLFVNPDTKQQMLVSGSMNYIKSKFNELKGKSKYLEAYTLDNGTYSRGLSYKDKKLTKDRLKSYDNENTSGGNGLYIVSYNEPVSKFSESYVATPNVRTEKDESYKKGHPLKNEIKNVVLHHTAYTDEAANEEQVRKQYMTPGANTSHVVIEEDGRRVVYASPEQVTFHAGTSQWKGRDNVNDYSIGVEFQGDTQLKPLTDAQIESFIEYYEPIAKRYNLKLEDIITHQMIRDEYIATHKDEKDTATKPDITQKEYKKILERLQSRGYKKQGGPVTWQIIN